MSSDSHTCLQALGFARGAPTIFDSSKCPSFIYQECQKPTIECPWTAATNCITRLHYLSYPIVEMVPDRAQTSTLCSRLACSCSCSCGCVFVLSHNWTETQKSRSDPDPLTSDKTMSHVALVPARQCLNQPHTKNKHIHSKLSLRDYLEKRV